MPRLLHPEPASHRRSAEPSIYGGSEMRRRLPPSYRRRRERTEVRRISGRSRAGRALRDRGYSVRADVVNAADFGVPQRRLRAILSATRCGDEPAWPRPTHGHGTPRAHRTVADAFALLPTTPDGRNWHRPYPATAQLERIRSVREGGARSDLPVDLVLDCWRNTRGFSDVLGRLVWHRPAVTMRTEFFRPEKGRFLHPTEDRPVTVREAARLQSFPDAFVLPESQTLTSVARQIGNAMPPRLAEAVGLAIGSQMKPQS